jgi:hypothetical protein
MELINQKLADLGKQPKIYRREIEGRMISRTDQLQDEIGIKFLRRGFASIYGQITTKEETSTRN